LEIVSAANAMVLAVVDGLTVASGCSGRIDGIVQQAMEECERFDGIIQQMAEECDS
jgi:hypothetical protein